MSTMPPMAQRTSPSDVPASLPPSAQPPPVSETAASEPAPLRAALRRFQTMIGGSTTADMSQAPLPAVGPLLTVAEAQAALDQVRQQLAQLPTQRRDVQQQLHALIAQVRDLERRVDREPGLDAPLAKARRSFTALDHYYDHTFPAEEKALKAREQAAASALRQAEMAVAMEAYNTLALQRPALWDQLSTHLDHLVGAMRDLLTLTQQQRDLASQAGFEFPSGPSNPHRLLAMAVYGTLNRLVATPPTLQEGRPPVRPYVDSDRAADLVDYATLQHAPPMVWIQAVRNSNFMFAVEIPFTGQEVHDLATGKAVRLTRDTFETLRRSSRFDEYFTLVNEPIWT